MKRLGAIVFIVLAASCSSGTSGVLEHGGPRIPSDQGVVTESTLERIQLDHKRNYLIDDKVESFTTRSHVVTSLLAWEGKFVQLGLSKSKKVQWIAGIGNVVPGTPPLVFYTGVVTRQESAKRRVYFDDGTVLVAGSGVKVPSKGTEVVCEIDPTTALVTKITPA